MTNPRNPAMDNAQVTEAAREAAAIALGYKNFADASDYRLTGGQDREVARMVQAFAKFERDTLARHRLERSEPVGWMYTHGEARIVLLDQTPDMVDRGWTETPVYTTTPEPVAEIERLRGALREIATVDENGLAEYTPQAMVAIARAALGDAS